MMHELMASWFEWTRANGYAGIFTMMALESTIVPIPSEIIIPPAGFYAAQGELNLWGVILAGGLSPENVAAAIEAVGPWGVDSLTHTNRLLPDGTFRKDLDRVGAFVAAARAATPDNG